MLPANVADSRLGRLEPMVRPDDPITVLARGLLYLSIFFGSLLVLRVDALTIGDLLFLAALSLAIVARSLSPGPRWTPPLFDAGSTTVIWMLFMLGAIPAVANASLPGESLAVVVRLALVCAALPWTCRLLLSTREHLARAVGWLIAGTVVSASGTLLQYAFGADVIPGAGITSAGRFSGFTGHVSDLGGVASLGIAMVIGVFVGKRLRRARLVALFAVVVLAIGLVLSGSVSGMISVAVAMFVYVARRAIKLRHLVGAWFLGAGILLLTISLQSAVSALSPIDRIMQTLGLSAGGRYSTSEIRIETFEIAIDKFLRSPFLGHGFDSISSIADGEFPPHNIIVGALFQGGILFATALLALAIRPMLGGWLSGGRSVLVTQLFAGAVAAATFAMTAPSLYNRYFWVPLALLATAQALSRIRPGRDAEVLASPILH